tara:strand:- start:42684 stop:42920 length:237 start_codon:yes stop_codon:yes gene_type:complete
MKPKQTFAIIIAVIFIVAMILFHNTMSFTEIAAAFIANSAVIGWLWEWFSKEEVKQDFEKKVGITHREFKMLKKKYNF